MKTIRLFLLSALFLTANYSFSQNQCGGPSACPAMTEEVEICFKSGWPYQQGTQEGSGTWEFCFEGIYDEDCNSVYAPGYIERTMRLFCYNVLLNA